MSRGPREFLSRTQQHSQSEMRERAVAELSSSVLQSNFRAIQALVPEQSILAMVKANAYGHGAEWAAGVLSGLPGLFGFGVATLDEGVALRASLGARRRKIPIVVFCETTPWSDEKGGICEQNGLTAVIATESDWSIFVKSGWLGKIPYEIQFNTGMNRLGISVSFAGSILKSLKSRPASSHPVGIFSHLAMSESPETKLSQNQLEKFRVLRQELGAILPGARFHLANSGGIWNQKNFDLHTLTDVVRPGLALYGIPPWPGAPERGLSPVMTFRAGVMAVHRLKPGDSIGYGGTFKVTGTEPVYAAILSAGYADGVPRVLSNQGYAWLGGQSTRFLGVVSMDMCAVRCTEHTKVGEWADLLGPKIDAWAQARAAGTIPYELLTSLSSRVKRRYE